MVIRLSLIALLTACGSDPEPSSKASPDPSSPPETPVVEYEQLEASRLLSRASLDLRGVRPTDEELETLAADPDALDALLDDYLDDPRLEGQVQELFTDVFLTRTDAYLVDADSFDLQRDEKDRLQREAGEEPVRIVARVIAEDLPIDEIVTGDWTLTNRLLAKVFPVDRPDGSGWQVSHYVDGRPEAGVLAANGLWWRYDSTFSNANRKRANAISTILLCDDYLARPVDFDRTVNVLDEEGIENSLRENPSCAACHDSLDPLASYLYGFSWYAIGGDEVAYYHPSRERDWDDRTGMAPSYYGEAGENLSDLGRQIADDPRFEACMVQRVTEGLIGRTLDDDESIDAHRDALRDGGQTLRPAMRSVLASPQYRAATDAGVAGGAMAAKLASPALMASQVEELTGFRWAGSYSDDLMTGDMYGYLTLAGGADGYAVTEPADRPGATVLLVHERLAEAAAWHAVDAGGKGESIALFDTLDLSWRPDTDRDAMAAVLEDAQRRALGHSDDTDALLELWEAVFAIEDDPQLAWTGALSAVLRDPDAILY